VRGSLARHAWRRERAGQFAARGDAELREDAIQVRADRAVREVQACADLTVGQAFGGELRDLQLLRGELVPRGGIAPSARFARGPQLAARLVAPARTAERVEGIARRPKRRS
jgi:hypothetical protein